MVDLSDMKFFVQAITAGSLSAGGRELGFSPAVGSKRLARLETQLGTRLVQRTSRRLSLTEEGAIYFERCRSILADVEEAEAAGPSRRADGRLVEVLTDWTSHSAPILVVFASRQFLAARTRLFIDVLVDHFEQATKTLRAPT